MIDRDAAMEYVARGFIERRGFGFWDKVAIGAVGAGTGGACALGVKSMCPKPATITVTEVAEVKAEIPWTPMLLIGGGVMAATVLALVLFK